MKVHEAWFAEALKLDNGESLYIECTSRESQKRLFRKFLHEKDSHARVTPIRASNIEVAKRFKDSKYWVSLTLTATNPLLGFKKGVDGKVSKIKLSEDIDRLRRIKLMVGDGMSKKEVEETLNVPLTEDEERQFFPEK